MWYPSSLKEWLVVILIAVGLGAGITAITLTAQNGAKNLSSSAAASTVQTAQTSYQVSNDTYGSLDDLTAGSRPALVPPAKSKIAIATDGDNYCAVAVADGGAPAWVYGNAAKPVGKMPSAALAGIACPAAP